MTFGSCVFVAVVFVVVVFVVVFVVQFVRWAEFLSLVYFLYLPLTGRVGGGLRTGWADVASLALAALAAVLQLLGEGPIGRLVRDWVPGILLILAYWMSGPYVGRLAVRLQRRLLALDRQLLSGMLRALVERGPALVLEALELAYLSCYPFVPAGLLVLIASGSAVSPDRFWTAVLLASLPCYALLPWLHTKPPRQLEGDLPIDRRGLFVRRLNMLVLRHGSVHANTFPSAHVSSTLAVALVVEAALPWAGAVFLVLAGMIAVSTVVGRYHYAADAVLGAALGVAGAVIALGL